MIGHDFTGKISSLIEDFKKAQILDIVKTSVGLTFLTLKSPFSLTIVKYPYLTNKDKNSPILQNKFEKYLVEKQKVGVMCLNFKLLTFLTKFWNFFY